jgi:hypothetical protein
MRELSECLKEKHTANPHPGTPTVSVFCIGKNRVVKIAHSRSELVFQTTKHMVIYPDSDPSLEVIALRPTV